MEAKKVLASAFLTTALVLTPVGVATAAPVTDTSPGVVDVNHRDRGWDDHRRDHGNDHKRGDRGHNDWDRGRHNDWDRGNHWRPNCFWFGPWLVCMPW
jgi:Ni/Co efflux regulator RcnB